MQDTGFGYAGTRPARMSPPDLRQALFGHNEIPTDVPCPLASYRMGYGVRSRLPAEGRSSITKCWRPASLSSPPTEGCFSIDRVRREKGQNVSGSLQTQHWRKTDSNSRSLREGKGYGQPLQASIARFGPEPVSGSAFRAAVSDWQRPEEPFAGAGPMVRIRFRPEWSPLRTRSATS
jgi:hypothetical protein